MRILDAAVERLRQDGPQGLKLASLAQELGISHQAILHHFGNRDGLVTAVVKRALDKLEAEIVGGFRQLGDQERRTEVLLETAFEIIVKQGNGRLLTWLMLSYPDGELSNSEQRGSWPCSPRRRRAFGRVRAIHRICAKCSSPWSC